MNLAQTQFQIKKFIIVLGILIIVYYTGQYLLTEGIRFYHSFFPPELPPPAAQYGILPQLRMTQIEMTSNPEYVLDTSDGRLPVFPDRAKVYRLAERQPNLLSEQQVKDLAENLEFTGTFSRITASEFRWVDGRNNRVFQGDAVTKNFFLETPATRLGTLVTEVPSITEADSISQVTGFLRSRGLFSQTDLENLVFNAIPTQVAFGQIRQDRQTTGAPRLMRINVHREIVNVDPRNNETKHRILGPNPRDSLVNFTVANHRDVFRFPIINFTYWEVDYEESSEYYIANINEVWNAVTQNRGIVSYLNTESGDFYNPITTPSISRIEIRNIEIAYYESGEYTQFLQPIYVFEGQIVTQSTPGNPSESGEIVIYFPAVRGDFVAQNTTTETN